MYYFMTRYKAMLKSELADAAGVSTTTFRKWLLSDHEELRLRGVMANAKLLTPAAVKYVCEKYCIDLAD